jgi:hypothetical protein
MPAMKRAKVLLLFGVALVSLVLASTTTQSMSGGILRADGMPEEGCTCHGPGGHDGVPNANVFVFLEFDPVPAVVYNPGTVYNITLGARSSDVPPMADSNQGGFNLRVNVGELASVDGFTRVSATNREATHTADGDMNGRTFNLTWRAPASPDEPAIFTLFVNTVNGNFQPDEGDHWNGGVFVIPQRAGVAIGAGGAHFDPEHIGVNLLAHWVGIVSFLAVIATLLIYYFVLKFGESVHTTDHRDRKEK